MESNYFPISVLQDFQSLSVSSTTLDFGPDFTTNRSPAAIIATISHYLKLHNNNMVKKFRLFFGPLDQFLPDIKNFIAFAVAKGVEELDLDMSMGLDTSKNELDNEEKPFRIPTCLFECETLTHLSLSCCEFRPPPSFTGFHQLQSLSLRSVTITDDNLQQLISNCPLLTDLTLINCSALEFLVVPSQSLQKLTMVNLNPNPHEIEISAPKLKSFIYYGVHIFGDSYGWSPRQPDDSFIDISSLSDAFISSIESSEPEHDFIKLIFDLRGVEILTVCSYALGRVQIYEDEKIPILLQNLKELQLLVGIMSSDELDSIYKFFQRCPSPLLEKLFIRFSEYPEGSFRSYSIEVVVEEPSEVTFSHLKVIKLSHFNGRKSEMRLVRFLLEKAVVLESLILVAPPKTDKESMKIDQGNSVSESAPTEKKDLMDLRIQLSLLSKASPGVNIILCEFVEDDMSVTPTHTEYFGEH